VAPPPAAAPGPPAAARSAAVGASHCGCERDPRGTPPAAAPGPPAGARSAAVGASHVDVDPTRVAPPLAGCSTRSTCSHHIGSRWQLVSTACECGPDLGSASACSTLMSTCSHCRKGGGDHALPVSGARAAPAPAAAPGPAAPTMGTDLHATTHMHCTFSSTRLACARPKQQRLGLRGLPGLLMITPDYQHRGTQVRCPTLLPHMQHCLDTRAHGVPQKCTEGEVPKHALDAASFDCFCRLDMVLPTTPLTLPH